MRADAKVNAVDGYYYVSGDWDGEFFAIEAVYLSLRGYKETIQHRAIREHAGCLRMADA